MITVTIVPINLETQELFELNIQPTANLQQMYDRASQQLQQFLFQQDQWPQFSQVAMYVDTQPTIKLSPSSTLQDLLKKKKDSKLVIVFPKNQVPLLQISINNLSYYYTANYLRRWSLYKVLDTEPFKTIIKNNQYQKIIINGDEINYTKEKDQQISRFLEGYRNSIVTILIKTKQSFEQQKNEIEVKPAKQSKGNVQSKEEERQEEKPAKNNNQQAKPAKVNQPKPVVNEQIKKEVNQQKNQPSPPPPLPLANQNTIQLIIKFQIYSGKQEMTFNVEYTSTMVKQLPLIISQLKSSGFDWEWQVYDHKRDSDKLHIIYQKNQFKKIDKPFKSLIKQRMAVFTFQRHYQGGAL